MKGLLLTEQAPARRGFLRSLIAAPVAALATHRLILPAQAVITPDDAAARLQRHLDGAEAAMRELFPGAEITVLGNCLGEGLAFYRGQFAAGRQGSRPTITLHAGPETGKWA